jgi:serpin B
MRRSGPAAILWLAAGCGAGVAPPQPEGGATGADVHALARDGNRFALELYLRRAAQEEGNLFLSPHSISTALAMTWAGARGETARQMAATLHFDLPAERLHAAFATHAAGVSGPDRPQEIRLANRLWVQEGQPILEPFADTLERFYAGGVERVDFGAARDEARRHINAWVEERTAGHIPELLLPEHLRATPVLILTNAIYFKGLWARPFDPAATRSAPFHAAGAERQVQMMGQTGTFAYTEVAAGQVLELPYAGEETSMVLLLPRAAGGLPALEAALPGGLEGWLAELKPTSVQVEIPRLKVRGKATLERDLAAMGMPDAFDHRADFSGINGRRDLYIFAVVHEATVLVDEAGTVASGATGVVMGRSARHQVFRADHPFVLLIRHRPSGAILFLGRVIDPEQA